MRQPSAKQLEEAKARAKRIADKYLSPEPEPKPLNELEAIDLELARLQRQIDDIATERMRLYEERGKLWAKFHPPQPKRERDLPLPPLPLPLPKRGMLDYSLIREEITKSIQEQTRADLIALGLIKPKPELKRRPL